MIRFVPLILASLFASSVSAQSSNLRSLEADFEALGWEAVGRLDLGGGFCSATLIAPDLVLTAAHCLFDTHGTLRPASDMTFRAGFRGSGEVAARNIARAMPHPEYQASRSSGTMNVSVDVALVQLQEAIPTTVANPFILDNHIAAGMPVSVVSYGRGREAYPSRQKECRAQSVLNGALLMDCEATFGSSGAPVFSHRNGRGRIVAVISGGIASTRGKAVIAPIVAKHVQLLKTLLTAQQSGPIAARKRVQVGQRSGSAKFLKP